MPLSAASVLRRALTNFNVDRVEKVRLTNRRGSRTYERELEVALKRTKEGHRVVGKFTKPESVRGTSFLVLPPPGGAEESVSSNQYFIYVPELKRLRRISGAQRSDSFFGTYLSQGDMEPHPPEHYHAVSVRPTLLAGEDVFELEVRPLFDAGYDYAILLIAASDSGILSVRQFREGQERPIREIVSKREWFEQIGGHALPTQLRVVDGRGRGTTEVTFFDRQVTSDIPESQFTTSHLLRRGD